MGLFIVLIAWLSGMLTWHIWLFAFLGVNANQIHKWAHRTRRENGRFVTMLHKLRLLQSPQHHARHHTDPKNSHYCTITNFLNPVLDTIRFWDGLEWLLAKTIHLHRQPDTSVRGHGPGPAWLKEFSRVPS